MGVWTKSSPPDTIQALQVTRVSRRKPRHSAVKQKDLNVSSGTTALKGGEDVNETQLQPLPQFDNLGYRLDDCQKVILNDQVFQSEKLRIGLLVLADKNNPEFEMYNEYGV